MFKTIINFLKSLFRPKPEFEFDEKDQDIINEQINIKQYEEN